MWHFKRSWLKSPTAMSVEFASKYCINWESSWIPKYWFLWTTIIEWINYGIRFRKVRFLKLKIDFPLVSNLYKTGTSFPHPQGKLINLFSLLLKLILKKFFDYFASRIRQIDLCFCISYNMISYYSTFTYHIIYMF